MSCRDRLADKRSLTHRQVDKALNAKLVELAGGNLESKSLGCRGIGCNARKLVSVEGGDCSKRSNFSAACASLISPPQNAMWDISCRAQLGEISTCQIRHVAADTHPYPSPTHPPLHPSTPPTHPPVASGRTTENGKRN